MTWQLSTFILEIIVKLIMGDHQIQNFALQKFALQIQN